MKNDSNLIWLDLELTGLKPEKDSILEIATIATDKDLNILEEGPDVIIHQPEEVIENMHEWSQKQHKKTGLIEQVRESSVNIIEAEAQTKEFALRFVEAGATPLAGNTVWVDRRFLKRFMPELDACFHYRVLDVSTIKELAKRWNYDIYKEARAQKKGTHRAMDDIRESIEELRLYRKRLFRG